MATSTLVFRQRNILYSYMLSTFTNLFSTMQNAQRKNNSTVLVRHTRWTQSLINVMVDQGLLRGYTREGYQLCLQLKPGAWDTIEQVSKSSKRVYIGNNETGKLIQKQGLGVVVISTPKGMYTAQEANALNVGGEVICKIYNR